jgi:hypothetical protein
VDAAGMAAVDVVQTISISEIETNGKPRDRAGKFFEKVC